MEDEQEFAVWLRRLIQCNVRGFQLKGEISAEKLDWLARHKNSLNYYCWNRPGAVRRRRAMVVVDRPSGEVY